MDGCSRLDAGTTLGKGHAGKVDSARQALDSDQAPRRHLPSASDAVRSSDAPPEPDVPATTPLGTTTLAPARPDLSPDDGDRERMSHIVLEGFKPEEGEYVPVGTNVVEGMVNGTPVKALCGKVWVPGRDPSRFPICPTCKEIATAMGWKIPSR